MHLTGLKIVAVVLASPDLEEGMGMTRPTDRGHDRRGPDDVAGLGVLNHEHELAFTLIGGVAGKAAA